MYDATLVHLHLRHCMVSEVTVNANIEEDVKQHRRASALVCVK